MTESFSTLAARKTLFSSVNSQVYNKMGVLPEAFPTLTTLKRPFSGVCCLVSNKPELMTEGFAAVAALVVNGLCIPRASVWLPSTGGHLRPKKTWGVLEVHHTVCAFCHLLWWVASAGLHSWDPDLFSLEGLLTTHLLLPFRHGCVHPFLCRSTLLNG